MRSKRGFIVTIIIIVLAFIVGFILFYKSLSGINLFNKVPERYCEKQGFVITYSDNLSYCTNELNESCDIWEFYREDCKLELPQDN
jgi:uncharacterized membrane protein